MEWSRYNILFISKDNNHFLYNSRINSFFELDQLSYNRLESIASGKSFIEELPAEEINQLVENKIIVGNREDDNYISQMQYLKRKKSFHSNNLSIVLAPTLGCNFKCPYCYEADLPSTSMREEIQNKLVDFINLHEKKAKRLSIYWHGGEPLIAFKAIQSILYKIKKTSIIPLTDHKMVTNGYLFNKDMCSFFRETELNYVQITIDGTEETHNKNRVHKSGIPTYTKIVNNIDMIVEEIPDCKVGVRVNIHNDNKEDYPKIYKELSERWKDKNCVIYPAFVLPQSSGCNVSCLSTQEKAQFYVDLYSKYEMKNIDFKPSLSLGSCSAIYENHYVIDPEGFLHKCWADIGIPERAIGDIETGIQKWDYVSEYTVSTDKFNDSKCLKCKIFPICEGGCNRFRLEYKEYGTAYNVCPIDEDGLAQYIEIIYEQSNKDHILVNA